MSKKILLISLLLVFIVSCSGCLKTAKSPIYSQEVIVVEGIDKENDNVKLTALMALTTPIQSGDSEPQKTVIYTAFGETIFDAIRNMHAYTEKDIFWGHVDFVIVGEETARAGLGKYLDLILRDHEQKQSSKLIIAQGSTASEFITTSNLKQTPLSETLTSLFADAGALSQTSDVTLLDYMKMMNSDKQSLYVTCAQMVPYMEKPEDEKDKLNVKLDGYAIFDEDKLIGFVNDKMARGLNFIINKVKSAPIVVKDPAGNTVCLEIINSKSKIDIDFTKALPSAKIKTVFTTNIGDYSGTDDFFHEEIIEFIKKEQEKVVKNEMGAIIDYLQSEKADVLGISNEIYHKYPVKSQDFKNNWKNIFSEMDISVEVKSRINRTYNTKQPVGHKSGDK